MTTFADLVTATLDQLTVGERELTLTLASDVSATTATFTFNEEVGGVLAAGAVIDVVDGSAGYESVLVTALNPAARQATVSRGRRGAAVAHVAGIRCVVNPRFESAVVWREVLSEIRSWGYKIFRTTTATVTADSKGLVTVPSAARDFYTVLEARRLDLSSRPTVTLTRIADNLLDGAPPSTSLAVTFAIPLDLSIAHPSLDISTIGMPESTADIPPMGAAWRLMTASEAVRTDTRHQSSPRDPQEVPAGSRVGVARFQLQARNLRLAEEASKLRARWGWREV